MTTTEPEPAPLAPGETPPDRGVRPTGPGAAPLSDDQVLADAATDVLEQAEAAVEAMPEAAEFGSLDVQRRLLLVHAHPDDETLSTGATIARYTAENAAVTLVTCTRGEQGEVIGDDLARLRGDPEQLARHRVEELAAACEALRCTDHRFLGGPGRWVDSGMVEAADGSGLLPTTSDPRAFSRVGDGRDSEAVAELVAVVREARPQVVVSYGPDGGYGHPDHVAAHRVTVAAVALAADGSYRPDVGTPWVVSKRYETALPLSAVRDSVAALRADGAATGFSVPDSPDQVGAVVDDEVVTTVVDAVPQREAVLAALRTHRTQVTVDGVFYALSHGRGLRVLDAEHYVLAEGERGAADGPGGREDDLFSGVRTA